MPPPVKASEFAGDLSDFLSQYKYQPKLTKKLDDLAGVNLTPELLNEIVLWKVNRYVSLDGEQLRRIDALRKLKPREHRQAASVLGTSPYSRHRPAYGVHHSSFPEPGSFPDH